MKNLILSITIVLSISFLSCTQSKPKEDTDINIKGHMIFTFEGDMNKPILPIIISTKEDSSYLKYSELQTNPKLTIGDKQIPPILEYFGCYIPSNINQIETKTYNEIKRIILSYYPYENHSDIEKPFEGNGMGILISDTKDSTVFHIPADSLFNKSIDAIIQFTEQSNLNKLGLRFKYFKEKTILQIG